MSTKAKKVRSDEIPEREIVKREFAFLWRVPTAGVQLRADFFPPEHTLRRRGDDHGPGPWLVPASPGDRRQYAPLDQTQLHRKFAKLKTDEGIERFASRYGLLGHSAHGVVGSPYGVVRSAESRARWTREIDELRATLELWDLVRRREPGKGASIDPDRLLVYETVNDRLEGHVSSVAHPARGGEILHWPDCLLSALYLLLQFELARRPVSSALCKLETCDRVIVGTSRKEFCSPSHGNLYRYHHRGASRPD